MKSKKTIYWIITSLFILIMFNCGDGGQDSIYVCTEETEHWVSNSGTIAADLYGSYALSGFEWDFYTVFYNYIRTVSEEDFLASSGALDIYSLTADVSYSIAGSVNLTGNWYLYIQDQAAIYTKDSVSWTDSTTGTVLFDGMEVMFSTSGNVLTLDWPMWCFLLEETPEEEPPVEPTSLSIGESAARAHSVMRFVPGGRGRR